jgi:citrate lyase beta subunit
MLEKSFASPADSVSYDLEDSVSPGKKAEARRMVAELLDVSCLNLRESHISADWVGGTQSQG